MKYIIEVKIDYQQGEPIELGFISSIKYNFIEKAARGEVKYLDKYGDVAINKMFSLGNKNNEIIALRSNFAGLHYMFCKVNITEDEARAIRSGRK